MVRFFFAAAAAFLIFFRAAAFCFALAISNLLNPRLDEFPTLAAAPNFSLGTCAGAILLAAEVENPAQSGLGALDIRIRRNAYGRQIDSSIREGKFVRDLQGKLNESPLEMVFIRAPKISHVGEGVEVLATEG